MCHTIWHQVSLITQPMVPSVASLNMVSITFSQSWLSHGVCLGESLSVHEIYSVIQNLEGLFYASYKWFSVLSSSGVELTALALWFSMFMMLYLAPKWWLLSQCKYCSVYLDFLYNIMDSVLLGSCVTEVTKNGVEPSGHMSSSVNLMNWSMLLICLRKIALCSNCCTTNVSSTYPS